MVNRVIAKVNEANEDNEYNEDSKEDINEDSKIQFVSYWGGNTLSDPKDLPWDSVSDIPDTFSQFLKAMKDIVPNEPLGKLSKHTCKPHPHLLSDSISLWNLFIFYVVSLDLYQ